MIFFPFAWDKHVRVYEEPLPSCIRMSDSTNDDMLLALLYRFCFMATA